MSGIEVTEPRLISKAPPEELVVSPDFIDAKDFVQTVKVKKKKRKKNTKITRNSREKSKSGEKNKHTDNPPPPPFVSLLSFS